MDDNNVARLESVTISDSDSTTVIQKLSKRREGGGGARSPLMLQKVTANPEKLTSIQNMDLNGR